MAMRSRRASGANARHRASRRGGRAWATRRGGDSRADPATPALEDTLKWAEAALAGGGGGGGSAGGAGEALGLEATWGLAWAPAPHLGYAEVVSMDAGDGGVPLVVRAGCDDEGGASYETCLAGGCRAAEADDAERALLAGLVRTGLWVRAVKHGALEAKPERAERRGEARVALRVRGAGAGAVSAALTLRAKTGLPRELVIRAAAGTERWTFSKAHAGPVAEETRCVSPAGQPTVFTLALEGAAGEADAAAAQLASPPELGPPPGTEFSVEGGEVEACRGDGGHFLVRAELDGQGSFLVLDSGSSHGAVDRRAADGASMAAFGEQKTLAHGGALTGRLRRGSELRLGALAIRTPLYMEVALDGAVRAPPGVVVGGLLGGDALRRCVLELRAPLREPGSPTPPKIVALAHDPATYVAPERVASSWQRAWFVDGTPYIAAGFDVEEGDAPGDGAPSLGEADRFSCSDGAWFMLNTGVGGTSVVFTGRAMTQLRLLERLGLRAAPGGVVSGAGEERGRISAVEDDVVTGRLQRLEFAGASFRAVRTLMHRAGDPPDLQVSRHAAGVLCADLFRGCFLVLDYPSQRVAVVQQPSAAS